LQKHAELFLIESRAADQRFASIGRLVKNGHEDEYSDEN
jgi:hypothetical protein